MADYRVISSDDHVMEPVDLWTSRGESKFKDRLPRVERLEVGDWWICDGRKVQTVATGTQAGVRFEGPETLSWVARVEELPPGGYVPEAHVTDMDIDGIDVSIIYTISRSGALRCAGQRAANLQLQDLQRLAWRIL